MARAPGQWLERPRQELDAQPINSDAAGPEAGRSGTRTPDRTGERSDHATPRFGAMHGVWWFDASRASGPRACPLVPAVGVNTQALCFAAYYARSTDELSGRTMGRLGYDKPDSAYAIGGTAELALRYSN